MLRKNIALFLILVPAVVFGQKDDSESYGIFANQNEYHEFMGAVKSSPEMMSMVPVINDIVLGNPIGTTSKRYGQGTDSPLGFLANKRVREELEILDYQFEEMQDRNAEITRQAAEQLRELDFADTKNLIARVREIQANAEKQMEASLLPEQMRQLRQIAARSQLRWRSLVDLLTSRPLKNELEISEEQAEELREANREIEEELEAKIAELRKKARDKLLAKLNQKQREQVEEIFGKDVAPIPTEKKRSRKSKGDKKNK